MSRRIEFKAIVRGITADEKKVEVKVLVDPADLSAHEDLLNIRGRELVCTMEETQQQMALDGQEWDDGYE